jgi:hypothetical protein
VSDENLIDEEAEKRLAANEAVFRNVNEGIERGQWPGDESQPIGFRCECARLGCNALVEISVREYEHVRSKPRRFVMLAGHEMPAVEEVVERCDGYLIVEKRGRAAGRADELDPRSR